MAGMTHSSCRVARPPAAAPHHSARPSRTSGTSGTSAATRAYHASAAPRSDAGAATPNLLPRWLRLCGLDLPDSSYVQIQAAMDDYQRRAELRDMLAAEPDEFLPWWYEQDYQEWQLTAATGSTDWAWLLLARAGSDVADSRFGAL
jgi:hypothetical protein